jgi:cell division transport system ATP-binding protein
MIRIKNVTKTYPNGYVALDNVNLHIGRNEFVYLVGQSGAGKSTLLNMLYKAETPSSGDIYIDNNPFFAAEYRRDLSRLQTTPQTYRL